MRITKLIVHPGIGLDGRKLHSRGNRRRSVERRMSCGSSAGSEIMPMRKKVIVDESILALKSESLSFREISQRLGKSLGSVTGRYYRLIGVRHPSQTARDARLKMTRELRRISRNQERSLAAFQAAIEMRSGVAFSVAVERAREAGATLEMIGACCGISKQALHKKFNRLNGRAALANPSMPTLFQCSRQPWRIGRSK